MACGGNGIIPAVRFSGRVLLFCGGGIVSVLVVSYQCWWYPISIGDMVFRHVVLILLSYQ